MPRPGRATAFNRRALQVGEEEIRFHHVAEGASDQETVVYQTGSCPRMARLHLRSRGNRYVDRYG